MEDIGVKGNGTNCKSSNKQSVLKGGNKYERSNNKSTKSDNAKSRTNYVFSNRFKTFVRSSNMSLIHREGAA
jgi:hypothetical protein